MAALSWTGSECIRISGAIDKKIQDLQQQVGPCFHTCLSNTGKGSLLQTQQEVKWTFVSWFHETGALGLDKNAKNASLPLPHRLLEVLPRLPLFFQIQVHKAGVEGDLEPGQEPLQVVTDSHLSPSPQLLFFPWVTMQ